MTACIYTRSYVRVLYGIGICILTILISISSASEVRAQVRSQSLHQYSVDSSHPVRLELKQTQVQTKVVGPALIHADAASGFSIVESVYTVRARAFGGDIYLPTYEEQVVFEPVFVSPAHPHNAVILGTPSIALGRTLEKKGDRYILKEYEEVDMKITVSLKVMHAHMPSRLTLRTRLNALTWFPVKYSNGDFDPGIDRVTGERLGQVPFVDSIYIPEQVTRVAWESDPVMLVKANNWRALEIQASIYRVFSALFK